MRPLRAISPILRVRRSVVKCKVQSSFGFEVLTVLALASPFRSTVIAKPVALVSSIVLRARYNNLSASIGALRGEQCQTRPPAIRLHDVSRRGQDHRLVGTSLFAKG